MRKDQPEELKFLIYISYSYSLPIGEPLEAEILKRHSTIKWFADEPDGFQCLKNKKNVLQDIQEVVQYHPDIVLTITDNVPDFISGIKVQVFHGFNAEKRRFKRDHFRIRGFFDLYCTQGPSTTSVFKKLQKRCPHFEVIETGWPKVDPLFPIEKTKHTKSRPTVFIASTFTQRLSLALREDVFKEIQRLSQTGHFQFLMVVHPKIPLEVKEKWQQLTNKNFSFYDTTQLIPLFKKSDIMFSDTTSAIQEFELQNKPVVTFNHFIPKPHLINITEAAAIETALRKAMQYPDKVMKELYKFNRQLHPYTDGKSSARVVDACIKFLNSDRSYLKKKPLNLIRKFKVRKKLNYWKL